MKCVNKKVAIDCFNEFAIRNPQSWWTQIAGNI